jgi:aminoglycoside phosphotransferase (APT) family kinase protein
VRRFAAQALHAATIVHSTHSRLASPHEVAQDMLSDLAWLESWVPALPPGLRSRTRAHADLLRTAALPLPCGRVHGDFSLSNLMIRSEHADVAVQPIDWEHSEAERPQHLDIFRFISTCDLMASRGRARGAIFRRMTAPENPLLDSLFLPWLARLGVAGGEDWRTPELLRALWWHYCVHAARREQERLATPGDFQDSTFLRNLAALEPL